MFADFFLLPTEYEIFGMVLLEAIYYKTVVLTTKNGGSDMLVESGKNGCIIEQKDAQKWASLVVEVSADQGRMQAIQNHAAAKISGQFTWDAMATALLSNIREQRIEYVFVRLTSGEFMCMRSIVTVVIPIYNVEKYLNRCVESVVGQTYKNLEILLIDDGSPDRCPQMCDEWAQKDSRIRVIHKKNAGLGMARNTGIENAMGQYICFFDSDDYVAFNTVERAVQEAERTGAELVLWGHSEVDATGKVQKIHCPTPSKRIYQGQEIREQLLCAMMSENSKKRPTNLTMSACMALFSMKTIQTRNWRFVSEREIISEDVYSLLELCAGLECVAILPDAFYFYCHNGSSLTHTFRPDRFEKIKYFYDRCIALCDEYGYSDAVKKQLGSVYCSFTIAALKMIMQADMDCRKKWQEIEQIVKDPHLGSVFSALDLREERAARMLILAAIKYDFTGIVYLLLLAKCKMG